MGGDRRTPTDSPIMVNAPPASQAYGRLPYTCHTLAGTHRTVQSGKLIQRPQGVRRTPETLTADCHRIPFRTQNRPSRRTRDAGLLLRPPPGGIDWPRRLHGAQPNWVSAPPRMRLCDPEHLGRCSFRGDGGRILFQCQILTPLSHGEGLPLTPAPPSPCPGRTQDARQSPPPRLSGSHSSRPR
jgi:hypothetical protein